MVVLPNPELRTAKRVPGPEAKREPEHLKDQVSGSAPWGTAENTPAAFRQQKTLRKISD